MEKKTIRISWKSYCTFNELIRWKQTLPVGTIYLL